MIFLPNCLVATATGTGVTIFVYFAVSGLKKAEPQLQLQQRHEQNLSCWSCSLGKVLY